MCTNTPGGYSCSCSKGGLILNPSDSHTCISELFVCACTYAYPYLNIASVMCHCVL